MINIAELLNDVKTSFVEVKKDVADTRFELDRLKVVLQEIRNNERLINQKINGLEKVGFRKVKKPARVSSIRVVSRSYRRPKFVGSISGRILHETRCPFAKNIKPRNRVKFGLKNTALNKGYRLCNCLKR